MHWCGEVDAQLQRRCVRHILKRQLPDGGWNIYHGGPSEINASVKAYFALKLAGCSVDTPFMREARANIMRRGGIPQMNTFSKLYLALLGQFPWQYLASDSSRNGSLATVGAISHLQNVIVESRDARAAGDHQPFQTHSRFARRQAITRTLSVRDRASRLAATAQREVLDLAQFLSAQ